MYNMEILVFASNSDNISAFHNYPFIMFTIFVCNKYINI